MALIYDLADPQELQGFVRAVDEPTYALRNVLPVETLDDLEYRFTRGDIGLQDAAPYRAFDTESPIGNRGGVARVTGELPPLSKKMRLGEEQRLRLRGLLGQGGTTAQLTNLIFDDAAQLARSILARLELARGQALSQGQVVIAENGVAATVTFGYTAAQFVTSDNRNADATAGDGWFDAPAYPVIDTLSQWQDEYVDRNGGRRPGLILTSTRVIRALLRNNEIAALAQVPAVGGPNRVTTGQLNNVLAAFELPPLQAYDVRVRVGGADVRVISDRLALFLPDAGVRLGRTFSGVTAEALELAEARAIRNDQLAGMTAVVDKTFNPVSIWTNVSAIALPTIFEPKAVTVATVLPA